VSVVIITWNARTMLKRCISSLRKSARYALEIFVIDNGSSDGTAEMVCREYRDLVLIRNTRNKGVAPARNQGLSLCSGDFILIIDDDAYLAPGSIDKFIEFMNRNAEVGLCGPRLTDEGKRLIPSCKRFPTPLSFILNRFTGLVRLSNRQNLVDTHLIRDWRHDQAAPVDYVIGACQFIRRKAFDEVGLLDDKIFYGPEDIDYCLRMWLRGWQVYYLPGVEAVHAPRRITKQRTFTLLSLRHFLAVKHFFMKYRIGSLTQMTARNDAARRAISETQ